MADFLLLMRMVEQVLDQHEGPNAPMREGFRHNQTRAIAILQKLRDEGHLDFGSSDSGGVTSNG